VGKLIRIRKTKGNSIGSTCSFRHLKIRARYLLNAIASWTIGMDESKERPSPKALVQMFCTFGWTIL
jgi:hypothetical protein